MTFDKFCFLVMLALGTLAWMGGLAYLGYAVGTWFLNL